MIYSQPFTPLNRSALACMGYMGICFVVSCTTGPDIKWTESKPKPEWISQIKKDATYFYYHGSVNRAESLEIGEKAARQNAYGQVAEYLNTTLESVYHGETTDYDQDLKDTIKARSEALVQKAEVIDSYHKKMTRIDKNSTIERYDVHVLVRYPKSEAANERKRQDEEVHYNVMAAFDLYKKGKNQLTAQEYHQARRFSHEALKILAKVKGTIAVGKDDVSNSQELESLLRTQEQEAISNIRRVVVWVQETSLDETVEPSRLATRMKATLNQQHFTILDQRMSDESRSFNAAFAGDKNILRTLKDQGAQYLIVGRASTVFSSTAMKQQFFDAQGTLRVYATDSGDTIVTVPINSRGYHRDRDRASRNALEEAGEAAGKTLVKEFLAREEQ